MTTKHARLRVREDGVVEALSVIVGLVRELPPVGTVVGPGSRVGVVSTLGDTTMLELPKDAPRGHVTERALGRSASAPVAFGEVLFRYSTDALVEGTTRAVANSSASGALVFRAPMAGRFYRKTSPDKPALVEVGEVVTGGRALGLVEVMKTFHRVSYGGDALPASAKVIRALVEDGADIAEGDALYELEAVTS